MLGKEPTEAELQEFMESYNPGSGEADLANELENEMKGLESGETNTDETSSPIEDLEKELENLENDGVDQEALDNLDKELQAIEDDAIDEAPY
jgi:hypothetical protein